MPWPNRWGGSHKWGGGSGSGSNIPQDMVLWMDATQGTTLDGASTRVTSWASRAPAPIRLTYPGVNNGGFESPGNTVTLISGTTGNGDFETGLISPWTNGGGTVAIDTTNGRTAPDCLAITNSGAFTAASYSGLTVGQTYVLTFWVKGSSTSAIVQVLDNGSGLGSGIALTTSYQQVTKTFLHTGGVLAISNNVNGTTVYVDDVTLFNITDAFASWNEPAPGGTSTIVRDTSIFRSGSASCRFDVDAGGSLVAISQPLVSGTTYTYSFYARSSVASGGTVGIWNLANSVSYGTSATLSNTGWTLVTGSFVANDAGFTIKRVSANGISLWIDDVTITAADGTVAVAPSMSNGDFESGAFGGGFSASVSASSTAAVVNDGNADTGLYAVKLAIDASNNYAAVRYDALATGAVYTLSFRAKSLTAGSTIKLEHQPGGAQVTSWTLTTSYQTFTYTFTAALTAFTIARLLAPSASVYIDNVTITQVSPSVVSQSSTSLMPVLGTMNGLTCLTFDGVANYLELPNPGPIDANVQGITVIAAWYPKVVNVSQTLVYLANNSTASRTTFGITSGGPQYAFFGRRLDNQAASGYSVGTPTAAPVVETMIVNYGADAILFYANGSFLGQSTAIWSAQSGQNVGPNNSILLRIGASANGTGSWCNADVGEIIVYNRVLSATERQAVETYLKAKWGTP